MKKAEIYSVACPGDPGFVWTWRESGGKTTCAHTFAMYFDCVTDARDKGFEVELTHAQGNTAPGGAEFRLQSMTRGDQQ